MLHFFLQYFTILVNTIVESTVWSILTRARPSCNTQQKQGGAHLQFCIPLTKPRESNAVLRRGWEVILYTTFAIFWLQRREEWGRGTPSFPPLNFYPSQLFNFLLLPFLSLEKTRLGGRVLGWVVVRFSNSDLKVISIEMGWGTWLVTSGWGQGNPSDPLTPSLTTSKALPSHLFGGANYTGLKDKLFSRLVTTETCIFSEVEYRQNFQLCQFVHIQLCFHSPPPSLFIYLN